MCAVSNEVEENVQEGVLSLPRYATIDPILSPTLKIVTLLDTWESFQSHSFPLFFLDSR